MGKCFGKGKETDRASKQFDLTNFPNTPKTTFFSIIPPGSSSHLSDSPPVCTSLPMEFCIKGSLPMHPQNASQDKPEMISVGCQDDILRQAGVGHICRKGLKSDDFNQDDFCITRVRDYLFLGVFDGHGPDGHKVSAFVKDNLPRAVFESDSEPQITTRLRAAFDRIHSDLSTNHTEIKSELSGTTASVVVLQGRKLHSAYVGDSKIVLAKRVMGKLTAEAVSHDHKPASPREKTRIEMSGGIVKKVEGDACYRVFEAGTGMPGLALSRAIGDLKAHGIGVTHDPETAEMILSQEYEFVLVCSDGIWEFITPDEAVSLISEFPRSDCQSALEALVGLSWTRWVEEEGNTVDDMTCLLVYLPVTL